MLSKEIHSGFQIAAALLSYSIGALAVGLVVKQSPGISSKIPLIIFTVFEWGCALILTLLSILSDNFQRRMLNRLRLMLNICSLITGIYWTDSLIFTTGRTENTSLLITQLQVALITLFMLSLCIKTVAIVYPKDEKYISEEIEVIKDFDPESLTTISKLSSQKTVRIKDSLQTLVPGMAEKFDLASSKLPSPLSSPSMSSPESSSSSLPQVCEAVLLPESKFFNIERPDTAFQFPEPIREEDEPTSFDDIQLPIDLPTSMPPPSPTKSVLSESSFFNYEKRIEGLDNLRDIPENSANRWPLFSTGAEENQTQGGKHRSHLNHVSMDSWKDNSERWTLNRERLGRNGVGIFTSTSKINDLSDDNSYNKPKLLARHLSLNRSFSDPASAGLTSSINQDRLEDQYKPAYGDNNSYNLDDDNLNSIMNQSFFVSYESLSRMSPETSPCSKSRKQRKQQQQQQQLLQKEEQPLQQLPMKLRTSQIAREYPPRHCLHSRSEPELNFQFINNLQNTSPKRNSAVSSFKGHRKAQSSSTSRSSLRSQQKHKLERKSQLKLIESHSGGETQLVVEGTSDDSFSSSESQNSVTTSNDSVPSAVIGQYDREKWRTIQRNKEEVC
ncbi:hypothetical protein FOA43_004682 [Brettanomyces nanus]|uniref:Uncharacterized protein n=1 Tax=Eeniella nana TaxID=13502 RepID=A0A875SF93_EENNA|nr:uncharacterized protein FOA43_004682 [Brettanomyces nanus]QPG77274.1 hypothetical protein FOA43_004682 [Brettanomyces nanus]